MLQQNLKNLLFRVILVSNLESIQILSKVKYNYTVLNNTKVMV